jgi:hypothetical protein
MLRENLLDIDGLPVVREILEPRPRRPGLL